MVFRIGQDNTEVFTLETNVSRSIVGFNDKTVSGSIFVIPRQFNGLKETYQTEKIISSASNDNYLEQYRELLFQGVGGGALGQSLVEQYMHYVHSSPTLKKYNSTASIYVFTPPTVYNSNAERRFVTQRLLERNPVTYGQESNWSTTNYHCLNFFTTSNTPVSSALIYPSTLMLKPNIATDTINYSNVIVNPDLDFLSGSGLGPSYGTSYQLFEAFSFDFWIKPKYNASGAPMWSVAGWADPTAPYYRPGTILHYSSSYAITLHSGSNTDKNNNANGFRISLQLGSNAILQPDTIPYGVDNSGSMLGSTFWSSDNSISLNDWTHVAITYGGHNYNQGTGSIWINGVKDRDINIGKLIPVATLSYYSPGNFWGALFLGNFYQGMPQSDSLTTTGPTSWTHQARFWSKNFNTNLYGQTGPGDWEDRALYYNGSLDRRLGPDKILAANKILYFKPDIFFVPGTYGDSPNQGHPPWDFPISHSFNYPLSAELHDVKLWAKQLTTDDIQYLQTGSVRESDIQNLRFWVPPFFIKESIPRFNEPITPFYSIGSPPYNATANNAISSAFPFAARLAMSINGFYPNLDNYLTDLITDTPPVQWNLRWWPEPVSANIDITSDQWFYEHLVSSSCSRKRLYTVLPNDHGGFKPGWNTLGYLGYDTHSFINQFGSTTNGRINLNNVMYYSDTEQHSSIVGYFPSGRITQNAHNFLLAYNQDTSSSITNNMLGARPENPTISQSFGMAIWQRMQTADSEFVTLIDISNLFYGESIKPGTFELKVNNLSGSNGTVGITIRDNGRGGLYRADTTSQVAEWSTIGSIMYNEGVAVIKYPQLYFLGKNDWAITFRGQRNVYVYTIETFADPQTCTESSDPVFTNIVLPPSVDYDPAETDRKQVFIGSVLIHDQDLNVIAKTQLAQPIVKRSSDKMMFRIKIDY